MSRKNKGRNRNRKTSGIGSTQGRQRDDVTGLTIEVDGFGSITSDKVYDKNSSLIRNTVGSTSDYLDQLQSFEAEVEFNKSYIVYTTRQVDAEGKVGATRTVFQGAFEYSGNRVKSARLDSMGQVSDSGDFGYGGTNYLGVTIAQPSSGWSWMSAINGALDNPSSSTASFDIGMETPGAITGNYAAVVSFGNGRFFYEGWENEPFSTNLL